MDALVPTVAVLALADGFSIGTLLIPVFMLLTPRRVRAGRVLAYLGTIALFYLAIGVLFTLGLANVVDTAAGLLASPAGQVGRLIVGAALLVAAFAVGADRPGRAVPGSPGRIARWRDRLLNDGTPRRVVVGVALAAGVIEVATMLPYLAAMTMLAEADLSSSARIAALAGYCALMIAPALVLLGLRVFAHAAVRRPLERLGAWLERTGRENTAWILGIVGFLIARGAAAELGLFEALGALLGGIGTDDGDPG